MVTRAFPNCFLIIIFYRLSFRLNFANGSSARQSSVFAYVGRRSDGPSLMMKLESGSFEEAGGREVATTLRSL